MKENLLQEFLLVAISIGLLPSCGSVIPEDLRRNYDAFVVNICGKQYPREQIVRIFPF